MLTIPNAITWGWAGIFPDHPWQSQSRQGLSIFEKYTYSLVNESRQKRVTYIFKLGGNVYAFDVTTIDLWLSVFWWAKFRKKKGGIKVHTLYDVETQISVFFHITEVSIHDSKVMNEIFYESGSYYIFDCAYNNFKILDSSNRYLLRSQGREKSSIQAYQV